MPLQKTIGLDSPGDWQEALKEINYSFAHTWENCYAMSLTTGFKTYLYLFENGRSKVICQISERTFDDYVDIVTPYGFGGFAGNGVSVDFLAHWQNFVKDKGYVCGYIGLNPILENGIDFEPTEYWQYNNIYVLDLTLNLDQLFANLSSNRRRQIKKWQRNIFQYEREALIKFFLENYHNFMLTRNAATVYNFSPQTLCYLLNLDNVFLVGAGHPEKIEAVSVFAYTPHGGEFLFNVSSPEGQRYSVSLLWQAVKYLKSMQVPWLNLGGGVHKNDSLAEFKERFGGQKLPLSCLKQIYRPETYERLCRQVNADPNDLDGYFPAYRRA